jgi:hypothetical protein
MGAPLSRYVWYFHALTASMARATRESGPVTFSALKTFPSLSVRTRRTIVPLAGRTSVGNTGSTRFSKCVCITSGAMRTAERYTQPGTPPGITCPNFGHCNIVLAKFYFHHNLSRKGPITHLLFVIVFFYRFDRCLTESCRTLSQYCIPHGAPFVQCQLQ